MFICNFDIGLSNLTANLAAMIDALLVGGYIKDVGGSFPWTEVELAPKSPRND